MADSTAKQSDLKQPDETTVHYLKYGNTPCPMSAENGPPFNWPKGNTWSQRWPDVTCQLCLKAKPEGE